MNIPIWIKSAGLAAKGFAIANGPAILFVGGLVVGGIAIVHAIKDAVTKDNSVIEKTIDDMHDANEGIKNAPDVEKPKYRKRKRAAIKSFLKCAIKLYGKTLALALVAAALMAGGFYWQSKRFAIASASAAASAAVINTIDNNIRDLFGEDGVVALHDPNFDAAKFKEKAEIDGATEALEKINKKFEEYKPSAITVPGDWTFKFDSSAEGTFWKGNEVIQNLHTLVSAQNMLNQKLNVTHDLACVTVNDALAECGMRGVYASSAGSNYGWRTGDFVDFGLTKILSDLSMIYDRVDAGLSNYEILDKYRDGIFIHFSGVRFLSDGMHRGGKE